jgi:hypothetical protein
MATGKPATRAAPALLVLVVLAAAAAEVSAQATNCNIVEAYIGVCALAIQKDLSPTFGAVLQGYIASIWLRVRHSGVARG